MDPSSLTSYEGVVSAVCVIAIVLLVCRWILRNQAGYRDFRMERSSMVIIGMSIFFSAFAFPKGVISDHIWSLCTGLGLGAIIGVIGLGLTRFDSLNVGKYAPNLHLAFAVISLVVVCYVFAAISPFLPAVVIELVGGKRTGFLLLGIMFGYFGFYHAALWIKFRNIPRTR